MDARPPRVFNDERRTLLAHLQFQRESLLRKIDGLTPAQLHWSPVASGTSLLWLLRHAGFAASIWVLDRFARLDTDPDLLRSDLQPHDTVASLDARYRGVHESLRYRSEYVAFPVGRRATVASTDCGMRDGISQGDAAHARRSDRASRHATRPASRGW